MRSFLLALLVCLSVQIVKAQEKPQAYIGAKVIPISGSEIDDGVVVVHRGKIVAVGAAASTKIPADAERHNVKGKVVMPGLVDTHSHIGAGTGGDSSGPIQSEIRLLDSINVRDSSIQRAQAGGITTVNSMPGSGWLIGGQTIYFKLRDGSTIEDLAIRDAEGKILGGLKMANGTNSQRNPPFPETRSKSASIVRDAYTKAQEYRAKLSRAGSDPDKAPARDLGLEVLAEVLEGKRTVHHHTHRHDDIVTVLRLAKEFGFKVVLHHVSEGWKVAKEIKAANAACSIIVIDSPGGKLETMDFSLTTGAVLEKEGVLVVFHTDDPITDSRYFLRSAALGVRGGMSREKALYALTLGGAVVLDLQDRVGSLEVGKDADFIVLSGDPLSVYTKVLETYVEGVKVFDRSDPKDYNYAVGGKGAGNLIPSHAEDEDKEEGR